MVQDILALPIGGGADILQLMTVSVVAAAAAILTDLPELPFDLDIAFWWTIGVGALAGLTFATNIINAVETVAKVVGWLKKLRGRIRSIGSVPTPPTPTPPTPTPPAPVQGSSRRTRHAAERARQRGWTVIDGGLSRMGMARRATWSSRAELIRRERALIRSLAHHRHGSAAAIKALAADDIRLGSDPVDAVERITVAEAACHDARTLADAHGGPWPAGGPSSTRRERRPDPGGDGGRPLPSS